MEACLVLKFFQRETSKEQYPIEEIISKLSHKPDDSWEQESRGFGYERRFHAPYIEEEITNFLEWGLSIQEEVSLALGHHDAELLVAVYTNGQVNPGIHVSYRALQLLNKLYAELDFDIYAIDGNEQ